MPATPVYPVLERITQNLISTMNGVTTVNHYRQTIDAVRDNPTEGWSPRDCLAVLHQADDEPVKAPYFAVGYKQHFSVTIFIFEDPETDVPVDQRLNYAVSDVTKALMADYQRNNDALDTQVGPPVPAEPEHGAIAGGVFRIAVTYRTLIDDPTTSV